MTHYHITQLEDYEPFIGRENVERIHEKARRLKGLRVANFNSTYCGGAWRRHFPRLRCFGTRSACAPNGVSFRERPITKKMHNALQGAEIELSSTKKGIFEQVIYENSVRNFLDHALVIVHDPQPLPLIEHYEKKCPWIWRCHLDLSQPDPDTWKYLRQWIDNYDVAAVSCKEFAQKMKPPHRVIMPAINPFNIKNRKLSDGEIDERLARYEIPTDLPLVVQIFAVRSLERSQRCSRGFQTGEQGSRCPAGVAG